MKLTPPSANVAMVTTRVISPSDDRFATESWRVRQACSRPWPCSSPGSADAWRCWRRPGSRASFARSPRVRRSSDAPPRAAAGATAMSAGRTSSASATPAEGNRTGNLAPTLARTMMIRLIPAISLTTNSFYAESSSSVPNDVIRSKTSNFINDEEFLHWVIVASWQRLKNKKMYSPTLVT